MTYDLAIIGAGWAGFTASIEAELFGLKVALIERDELGGTCLNRGCIPTKSLVHSSNIIQNIKLSANLGIKIDNLELDIKKTIQHKDKVVSKIKSGMESLVKRKNIDYIKADAKIIGNNKILFNNDKAIEANYILIASGSKPAELSFLKFDNKRVLSSTELLNIQNIPRNLLIIGGGVIGCEFAQIFNSFQSKVTVVELMDQLIPNLDNEASKKILSVFKKKGIEVLLSTDVTKINLDKYDAILVCVGRRPALDGLGLETLGIKLERGKIITDSFLQTNIPNIFAAGDCTSQYQLAHIAAYEGRIAVYNIYSASKNESPKFKTNYSAIPNCIFTEPEVASVGITEDEAIKNNRDISVTKSFFLASGMANILEQTEGFIKLVIDKKTNLMLGGVIVGPRATELVNILTLAINCSINSTDLKETIFGHPSLSEIITESIRSAYTHK